MTNPEQLELTAEDRELIQRAQKWSPEMRAKMAKRAQAKAQREQHVWYCKVGRTCDGRPHAGAEYSHARSDQWPPNDLAWLIWLIMSGRGAGKTRSGSEWVRTATKHTGRIAMIGRRGTDVRATMVEGDSGLIRVCENAGMDFEWLPSKREFKFGNGAIAFGYSAEEPDSLRGPQHGAAWGDEPAHWDDPQAVMDNLQLGLRLQGLPGGAKMVLTTTPIPIAFMKAIVADPDTRLSRASTYANLDNLDPTFKKAILSRYEGTRLGRQELHGEILPDVEGAMWQPEMIHPAPWVPPHYDRIVVAIDPAGTRNKKSDDTGIIAVGKYGEIGYVLADRTGKYSPDGWANAAIDLYLELGADAIVAENNFGGDMVAATLRHTMKTRGVEIRIIVARAQKSKELRAEPIVGLYEQERIYHIPGLADLETEMLEWVPGTGPSPNRVDALVWGATELMKPTAPSSLARVSTRTLSMLPRGNRR